MNELETAKEILAALEDIRYWVKLFVIPIGIVIILKVLFVGVAGK